MCLSALVEGFLLRRNSGSGAIRLLDAFPAIVSARVLSLKLCTHYDTCLNANIDGTSAARFCDLVLRYCIGDDLIGDRFWDGSG